MVSLIIFRQQHKMVVSVLSLSCLFLEPGSCRHINLTSDDRLNPFFFCRLIKIDHAIHSAVVCNGNAVHSKFFCLMDQLFDLAGTIQKTVFRMNM